MRTYRSVSVAAFAIALSALVGGFFGRARPGHPGRPAGTHERLHGRAQADRAEIRRAGRVGSRRLQRHQRHAPDARSALELHGSEGLRAAARAAGRPLLRPRHQHQRRRRRHHRHVAVRRIARLQEGDPPRRRHREDQQRRRQGLDERAGGSEAARTARDAGSGVDPPRRLRQARSMSRSCATRSGFRACPRRS